MGQLTSTYTIAPLLFKNGATSRLEMCFVMNAPKTSACHEPTVSMLGHLPWAYGIPAFFGAGGPTKTCLGCSINMCKPSLIYRPLILSRLSASRVGRQNLDLHALVSLHIAQGHLDEVGVFWGCPCLSLFLSLSLCLYICLCLCLCRTGCMGYIDRPSTALHMYTVISTRSVSLGLCVIGASVVSHCMPLHITQHVRGIVVCLVYWPRSPACIVVNSVQAVLLCPYHTNTMPL